MKSVPGIPQAFAAALLLAALCAAPIAGAVTLSVAPYPVSQVGATAQIQFGHTVISSTNYNRLNAGGTYVIACAHPSTQALRGQRTLSASGVFGGLQLYVTIPETIPGRQSLPGFTSVPRGTTLSCTYEWTARAAEANYSIGGGGIGITVGGEERSDGGTYPFQMIREDNDGEGCIRT